eukprot:9811191-Heterocapsa_arctica.AAC.1
MNDKQHEYVQLAVNTRLDSQHDVDMYNFMNSIAEAAEANLTIKSLAIKQNDCEAELQYIINDRQAAVTTGTEE